VCFTEDLPNLRIKKCTQCGTDVEPIIYGGLALYRNMCKACDASTVDPLRILGEVTTILQGDEVTGLTITTGGDGNPFAHTEWMEKFFSQGHKDIMTLGKALELAIAKHKPDTTDHLRRVEKGDLVQRARKELGYI